MSVLLPYLEERSDRLVLTSKGILSRHLQLIAGDVILNADEKVWSVEIKVENKHTGNLFLETWSNRNLENKLSHAERGQTPGWLLHTRADVLLYYFLDTDDLYTLPMFVLKQWCFGKGDMPGNIYKWEEKRQGKHEQLNDTWGRCIPISRLQNDLPKQFRHCKVKQLSLLMEAA